ncbi:type II toxin-antitoxin system HicA family toxin [Halobaculum sp. MBLA0147]|uniref:type II toxin-antitoxin system HicA family toxin n=1 Tax=Halobaculum sp. MBLA0147 TaxID=3079934 RepID=UPI003525F6B9
MSHSPFSGDEVVSVMVGSGIYELDRISGDHAILVWNPPADHDADARTVPVPLHDELSEGTLREIGEQAGMRDFQRFKDWLDENC